MYWQNIQCLCTPVFRLVEQLLNTYAPKHIHTRCSTTCVHDTLSVWRYDKVEWNLFITVLLLLFAGLFVLQSDTHTYQLLLCCSLIHLPALLEECHVSAMRQRPTNELRWERLGSVVGTLLPSLLSLPGNRRYLREGPPSRPLSEWTPNKNSHQQVSYTSQCWFFCSLFFFPPPSFFSFMAGTLLYILAGLRKKRKDTKRETKQSKCGNFSLFLFSSSKSFYQY